MYMQSDIHTVILSLFREKNGLLFRSERFYYSIECFSLARAQEMTSISLLKEPFS